MPDLEIQPGVTIAASELRESFARAGGPGGQHVNKVETKVELRWKPEQSAALDDARRARLMRKLASRLTLEGDLVITSAATRDQTRNREDARQKLVKIVQEALRQVKKRRATRPTKAAKERRLTGKKQRSEKKRLRDSPDSAD